MHQARLVQALKPHALGFELEPPLLARGGAGVHGFARDLAQAPVRVRLHARGVRLHERRAAVREVEELLHRVHRRLEVRGRRLRHPPWRTRAHRREGGTDGRFFTALIIQTMSSFNARSETHRESHCVKHRLETRGTTRKVTQTTHTKNLRGHLRHRVPCCFLVHDGQEGAQPRASCHTHLDRRGARMCASASTRGSSPHGRAKPWECSGTVKLWHGPQICWETAGGICNV